MLRGQLWDDQEPRDKWIRINHIGQESVFKANRFRQSQNTAKDNKPTCMFKVTQSCSCFTVEGNYGALFSYFLLQRQLYHSWAPFILKNSKNKISYKISCVVMLLITIAKYNKVCVSYLKHNLFDEDI